MTYVPSDFAAPSGAAVTVESEAAWAVGDRLLTITQAADDNSLNEGMVTKRKPGARANGGTVVSKANLVTIQRQNKLRASIVRTELPA